MYTIYQLMMCANVYLINFKYEISLAPAFAFRCLSSLRCEGHLEASCPAPNANVHSTVKRDLVYVHS